MMADIERAKEPARKKAERKWANNDLRRRYKEAKQANAAELEPPKPAVVTIENPHFEEQRQFQELVERNRAKFINQMKKLIYEGREQGIRKYKLSVEQEKRRYLAAKLKMLLKKQREKENGQCAAK
jgi:hypothetical protein